MKRPTEDQFAIARLWLEGNEGEGEERGACEAVARWIAHEERERWLRRQARTHGITVAVMRRKVDEILKGMK
jgi:hypothetical protein